MSKQIETKYAKFYTQLIGVRSNTAQDVARSKTQHTSSYSMAHDTHNYPINDLTTNYVMLPCTMFSSTSCHPPHLTHRSRMWHSSRHHLSGVHLICSLSQQPYTKLSSSTFIKYRSKYKPQVYSQQQSTQVVTIQYQHLKPRLISNYEILYQMKQ